MAQLIAQVQLGNLPVQGGQLPLQPVLLYLHGGQGDVGGLAGHNDLVLQVFQLPDGVSVVSLHVPLFNGVELLAHGVVGAVQLVIGAVVLVVAHQPRFDHRPGGHDQTPLGFGQLVELEAQVLLQVVVVDFLQHVDALLNGQHL